MTQPPSPKPKRPKAPPAIIGWMEMVDLPLLGLAGIKSKVDTGARTTALHATQIEDFMRDGVPWIRFCTRLGPDQPARQIEAPIHDARAIKNTSGIPEDRHIIRTRMQLGARAWMIDLSITDRSNMTFPMIIGRAALKDHNIAVHTRRTYQMTPRPPGKKKKSHRKDIP